MSEISSRIVLGVLASGSGTNLQAILDNIEEGRLSAKVGIVISDNKDAYALQRAKQRGIPACFVDPSGFDNREEFDQAIAGELLKNHVELVVLAGFMRIVTQALIGPFRNRIMNIHPALLPAFRGLDAQKQALDYGAKIAGATVHFVDEGMDTGPVIIQAAVPVAEDDTIDTLTARILKQEHKIYPMAVQLFAEGRLKVEGRRVSIRDASVTAASLLSPSS